MADVDFSCTAQEVVPGLFIGPLTVANSRDLHKKYGICTVVTCMKDALDSNIQKALSGGYLHVPLYDDNLQHLVDPAAPASGLALLRTVTALVGPHLADPTTHGAALIHCSSGVSRSATVVIAVLMMRTQRSVRQAFDLVSAARPPVLPNDSLFEDLLALERLLFAPVPATVKTCDTTSSNSSTSGSEEKVCADDATDQQPSSSPTSAAAATTMTAPPPVQVPSMDHSDYLAFSLRSVTGGRHSWATCKAALSKHQGDVQEAVLDLL